MDRTTRQAYRDLAKLSDRHLADIGLTRADIPARFQNPISRPLFNF